MILFAGALVAGGGIGFWLAWLVKGEELDVKSRLLEHSLTTVKNYVETLEELVTKRTKELSQAKSDAEYWREKADGLLATMLPENIAKKMVRGKLHAEEIYGTVMYTDLVDFTSYSKNLPPQEIEAALTHYFTTMSDIAVRHNGWVNKFLGDGILVIFGLTQNTRHAEDAARAALLMREAMSAYPWQIRIGIATGPFIAGEFGSNDLRRFDCIGHTVNLGDRLQSLAEGNGILVCEETFKHLSNTGLKFLPKRVMDAKGIGEVSIYPLAG